MPTASIDFTLASIAMIIVTVVAISGTSMVIAPHLDGDPSYFERYYQIGRYMLISKGDSPDWGNNETPNQLGFAAEDEPYNLNIDKVTRLNPKNNYAVTYSTLWQALGIDDVSFRISIKPLFELTLNEVSSQIQGEGTVYNFSTQTTRNGYPLSCYVSYYVVIGNSTYSSNGSTDSLGYGTVKITLPNSMNGTALLVVIAKAEESIVSYGVRPFGHQIGGPSLTGEYATLSPLDFNLTMNLEEGAVAWKTKAFTYSYSYNLTASGSFYAIPRVIERSPIIITLTGTNGSVSWVEWVAYPQVPLEVGADMEDNYIVSDVCIVRYLVDINGVLYRFEIEFRSPGEYD